MRDATSSNGFRTSVTATLSVRDWARAVDFYKAAFGASELYRVVSGGVAQLSVRGAEFWVAEESPEHLNFSPESLGGCSVRMLLIVKDPVAVCAPGNRRGRNRGQPGCRGLWLAPRTHRRPLRTPLGDRQTLELKQQSGRRLATA